MKGESSSLGPITPSAELKKRRGKPGKKFPGAKACGQKGKENLGCRAPIRARRESSRKKGCSKKSNAEQATPARILDSGQKKASEIRAGWKNRHVEIHAGEKKSIEKTRPEKETTLLVVIKTGRESLATSY